MKFLFSFYSITWLVFSSNQCGKRVTPENYKGRLEIAGVCMNYTIKLLSGKMDTSQISTHWRDDVTGKTYSNVFALKNACSFPASIKQGDEFYFSIDTSSEKGCMTCMAYYPKPPKKLSIRVVAQ
jgi:hypothetical protein